MDLKFLRKQHLMTCSLRITRIRTHNSYFVIIRNHNFIYFKLDLISHLVFIEADMCGIKDSLNYQNKAIYCKFKSDLIIVYEVKGYKLSECFLLPQLVLREWKAKFLLFLYGLTESLEVELLLQSFLISVPNAGSSAS